MTQRDQTDQGQRDDQGRVLPGQPEQPDQSRTGTTAHQANPAQKANQPDQRSGEHETPEEWLEEHSLGNPGETGNTITGENEY